MQTLLRALALALTLPWLTSPASAQELVPFRVGISDAVNTVLPVWMAQEGGFYAANGLKVEIVNMGGGSRGAKALQAGTIDLMRVGMSSVVQANRAGGDLRLIASMSNVIRFVIVTAPGVKTAADLKGGVIGVSSFGSESDSTVTLALERLNLTRADVHGIVSFYRDFRRELPGRPPSFSFIFSSPTRSAQDPVFRQEVERAVAPLRRDTRVARVLTAYDPPVYDASMPAAQLVSRDGRRALVVVELKGEAAAFSSLEFSVLPPDVYPSLRALVKTETLEVLPVVERGNGLLFYPSQYEGEESSPNIYYTGATPHQQGLPAINHLRAQGCSRFFLVGTDYVYPRTTNAVLKGYLAANGIKGTQIAERYTAFGQSDWREVVADIRSFARGGRAAVVSTVSGDANLHFYRELASQGVRADKIPVMSLTITEAELPALMRSNLTGHLVAWSYLQAFDRRENRDFIAAWRRFTGRADAVTNDPMEATWIGFQLWAAAVEKAGTTEIDKVRRALAGRRINAPSGFEVKLDGQSHHLYKPAMIGRITNDGRIVPVSVTDGLVPPQPFSPWLPGAKSPRSKAA